MQYVRISVNGIARQEMVLILIVNATLLNQPFKKFDAKIIKYNRTRQMMPNFSNKNVKTKLISHIVHIFLIAGVHERPHIYTLMQTHINPEMTAIRPIPLLLPHHHKSVPGEKRVGNQP